MDIDLGEIDTIVLSHGHDDHTKGLKYYFDSIKPKHTLSIVAHPDAFKPKINHRVINIKEVGVGIIKLY